MSPTYSSNDYVIKPGFVYVILQQPDSEFVKIGITHQSMDERMDSLDNTSVPVPPTALWYEYVSDPKAVEIEAHAQLDEHRVRKTREWFRVAPAIAIKAVASVAAPYRLACLEVATKAEFTTKLRDRFGSLIRKDIQRVSVLHTGSQVILESISRSTWGDAFITHYVLSFPEEDRQTGGDFLDGGTVKDHVEMLLKLDPKSFATFYNHLVDSDEANRLWGSPPECVILNRSRKYEAVLHVYPAKEAGAIVIVQFGALVLIPPCHLQAAHWKLFSRTQCLSCTPQLVRTSTRRLGVLPCSSETPLPPPPS